MKVGKLVSGLYMNVTTTPTISLETVHPCVTEVLPDGRILHAATAQTFQEVKEENEEDFKVPGFYITITIIIIIV